MVNLTVCFYHVTYEFQSELTLYICLNVKKLLAQKSRDIWSLSACRNGTRTNKHLVRKRRRNHLDKVFKWLSCVVSTDIYGPFDCMLLSCHIHISEWIHTLYLHKCQESSYSKQGRYLKFKWVERDSNPYQSGRKRRLNLFSEIDQIIEPCCEYWYVRCIWLYIIIMSRTYLRVNPHSIFARMSRDSLVKIGAISEA